MECNWQASKEATDGDEGEGQQGADKGKKAEAPANPVVSLPCACGLVPQQSCDCECVEMRCRVRLCVLLNINMFCTQVAATSSDAAAFTLGESNLVFSGASQSPPLQPHPPAKRQRAEEEEQPVQASIYICVS